MRTDVIRGMCGMMTGRIKPKYSRWNLSHSHFVHHRSHTKCTVSKSRSLQSATANSKIKLSLYLTKHHATKMYWGMEV